MRKTLIATTALALALAGCATSTYYDDPRFAGALPGGMTLIESVRQSSDEINIPYHKFELPNGLTVILHEDRSDPLVHVDVTYHVGSAREEIGKSGFAHLFEHMMFQGSVNVGDEEHIKIVSESGGTMNGSTNPDRTNYFQTVPSNQLEKMLWLEADRMGFFVEAVTEEKFETQREVVINERKQRYDNRPYGLLGERLDEAFYPVGHPYSWQTIGYLEDIERAKLEDVKAFFLRWYGPNNATLTIGGDIDVDQTLEWVTKYFGPIPQGPAVEDAERTPVTLDGDRYISMEDDVALPLLYMAWPTVYARHPDEAPLDVLMSILGSGRTSLFYENLVENGKAVQASANHPCAELNCQFQLYALPNPAADVSLADLEAEIRSTLVAFETRGVLEDDLNRVKAGIVSARIFGLQSVSGKVSQLAFYETFEGDPNYTAQDIARYQEVTAEDVVRVYNQYIKDKPAVIMSVTPTGQADAAAGPDNWTPPARVVPDDTASDAPELELRQAVDTFDRSVQPPASDTNPTVTLPDIWRDALVNDVAVLGAMNNETPTTTIQIRIESGQRQETLETLGLASLTASMLGEATEFSSNEDLSNRLGLLGSSIGISSGDRFTTLTIQSLSDNLDETLAIAAERFFHPAFAEDDFARLKDQTLQSIETSQKEPAYKAAAAFQLTLYGRDNPFAYPSLGLTETVEALTLDDLKAFYNAYYSAAAGSIVVVSDLDQQDVMDSLEVFEAWDGDWTPEPFTPTLPEPQGGVIYVVDNPDAAQSEIRIGWAALPFDATGDYFRANIMNYVLGGAFNSRINLNLREDKSFTYGAGSYFTANEAFGRFQAGSAVQSDVTGAALKEFLTEIETYRQDGITDEELVFTKQAIGQRDALAYETPGQKFGLISQVLVYDLPLSFIDTQKEILANITRDEINAIARERLTLEDMIIVVVGNREEVLDQLKPFGKPIVEVDPYGAAVE